MNYYDVKHIIIKCGKHIIKCNTKHIIIDLLLINLLPFSCFMSLANKYLHKGQAFSNIKRTLCALYFQSDELNMKRLSGLK